MTHKALPSYLRAQTLPRFIFPVVFAAVCILLLFLTPMKQRLHITTIDTPDEIPALYDAKTSYARITVDELFYTGVDYQVNHKTKASVYYTIYDDTCYYFIISVKEAEGSPASIQNLSVSVKLMTHNIMLERINASMSKQLQFSESGLRDVCCPVLLNQYDFTHDFITFALTAIYILLVLSVFFFLLELSAFIFPTLTISVRRLRHYGNYKKLYERAAEEFSRASPIGRKDLYMTDSFFIVLASTGIDIIPLENIVWIYQTNEVKQTDGKVRMYHPLCIVTDDKKIFRIRHVAEAVAAKIMDDISERYPNVMVGYDL